MQQTKRYRLLVSLVRTFTPKTRTEWEVPYDGEPCVFCPNHARAWGPIAMAAFFDLRDNCRIWYNAGISDRKGLPAYVRNDNWWNPKSKLAWFYNATVPYLASWILPPVIHSTPHIPVYYDMHVVSTFRESTQALKNKENLVIFAQFPDGYQSHADELSKGFLLIAPMAWKKCGIKLKFYPVHIDDQAHVIHVCKPIQYDPDKPREEAEAELLSVLNTQVHD